jgi:hypothetical protein
MKLGNETREKLAATIKERASKRHESFAQIGLQAGVHPSQASRICRGNFRTASHNVVQICKVLGIPLEGANLDREASSHQRKLEAAVVAVWDRSPEDADRIVRVLKELKAFRAR